MLSGNQQCLIYNMHNCCNAYAQRKRSSIFDSSLNFHSYIRMAPSYRREGRSLYRSVEPRPVLGASKGLKNLISISMDQCKVIIRL